MYEPPGLPPEPTFLFRMKVHASMRAKDHLTMAAISVKRALPWCSVCSCESGVPCAHQYCLLMVLEVMQLSLSYASFCADVLCYDPARAPSGRVNWWSSKYSAGQRPPPPIEDMERSVWDEQYCGPLAFHDSSAHVCMLRDLCWHFRRGRLAQVVRQQYGELVAPPPFACGVCAEDSEGRSEDDAEQEIRAGLQPSPPSSADPTPPTSPQPSRPATPPQSPQPLPNLGTPPASPRLPPIQPTPPRMPRGSPGVSPRSRQVVPSPYESPGLAPQPKARRRRPVVPYDV